MVLAKKPNPKQKHGHLYQWNRIVSSVLTPCKYNQPIFNKGAKNIQKGKYFVFNKWYCENWINTCKKIKLDNSLTLLTDMNFKWIRDFNIRLDVVKLLEEDIGNKILDIGNILDMTPKAQTTKAKINKWDYIKLEKFCTEKQSTSDKATYRLIKIYLQTLNKWHISKKYI